MIDQSRTTDARGLYPKMFWKTQYLNYVEELKSGNESGRARIPYILLSHVGEYKSLKLEF